MREDLLSMSGNDGAKTAVIDGCASTMNIGGINLYHVPIER